MQGYGVRPDAEVLDMIDTAARQKQVGAGRRSCYALI